MVRLSIFVICAVLLSIVLYEPASNASGAAYKKHYNIYYVKFTGSYDYKDANKFQDLMIRYSRRLKNLYVSSFSDNFIEIKVLYYGSGLRFFKLVKNLVGSYLNGSATINGRNVIVVNVTVKKN